MQVQLSQLVQTHQDTINRLREGAGGGASESEDLKRARARIKELEEGRGTPGTARKSHVPSVSSVRKILGFGGAEEESTSSSSGKGSNEARFYREIPPRPFISRSSECYTEK